MRSSAWLPPGAGNGAATALLEPQRVQPREALPVYRGLYTSTVTDKAPPRSASCLTGPDFQYINQ